MGNVASDPGAARDYEEYCYAGKSGKSGGNWPVGGTYAKSEKGGGGDGRRKLVGPGTEEFHATVQGREELRGELMSSLVGTNGRDLRTKTAKATNADATPTYFPTSIPTYYPTALGDGDYDYSKSKSGKGEVCFEYDPCDPTTYPDSAAKGGSAGVRAKSGKSGAGTVEGEAADSNSVMRAARTRRQTTHTTMTTTMTRLASPASRATSPASLGPPRTSSATCPACPRCAQDRPPSPLPLLRLPASARTCPSSSLAASASAAAACQRTAPTRMPRAAAMPTSPSRACATSMTADFHPPACARSCPSPSPMGSAPATAPPTTPAPTMPLKPIAVAPSSPLVAAPATTAATPSLPCLPPTFPRACPRMCPLPCLSRRWPPLSPQQAARRRSVRRSRVRRRRVEETRVCRSTEPQWIPEEEMLKASFSIGSSLMFEWICGSTCVQRIAHHLPVFIQADTLQAIA